MSSKDHKPYCLLCVRCTTCNEVLQNLTSKVQTDAEYIIFNSADEGYDQANTFYNNFSGIQFGDPYLQINFTSNKFMINSELKTDDFTSLSSTIIYFGKNRNGEILSRTYNGI